MEPLSLCKKIHIDLLWKNVVNTIAPSFLIESSSFLQVTRICKKHPLYANGVEDSEK